MFKVVFLSISIFNLCFCRDSVISIPNLYNNSETYLNFMVLHANDMFSRIYGTNKSSNTLCRPNEFDSAMCYGGMLSLSAFVNIYREKSDKDHPCPVLFFNAGNTVGPSIYFYVHRSKVIYDLLNTFQINAGCFGINEFDFGVDVAQDLSENLNYPVVLTNLRRDDLPKIKRSHILTVDGHKIGIVGYTRTYPFTQSNVTFENHLDTINCEAMNLRAQGVNTIIAIGNSDLDSHLMLVKNCPFVDVIIAGYALFVPTNENKEIWNKYPLVVKNSADREVPIYYAGMESSAVGITNLTLDRRTGNLVSFVGLRVDLIRVPPLPKNFFEDARNLLKEKYDNEVEQLRNTSKGIAHIRLYNKDLRVCRKGECSLGNAIADNILKFYVTNYNNSSPQWTDTSIVLLAGSAFGYGLNQAKKYDLENLIETCGDLYKIVKVKLLGKYLLKVLNHAISEKQDDIFPYLLQVSGLRIVYDVRKQEKFRVVKAFALCTNCTAPAFERIVKHYYYNVLVDERTYLGRYGYEWFLQKGSEVKYISEIAVYEMILLALENKLFYAEFDGRIEIRGENHAAKLYINLLLFATLLFYSYNKEY